jgi:hypothetical protein
MKPAAIPDSVKEESLLAIARFNQTTLAGTGYSFVARFQGKNLYLSRNEFGQIAPICRLQYMGAKRLWEFAIYKYSSGRYDPEEMWFPGAEMVDGTVEGAMKAGMLAYQ